MTYAAITQAPLDELEAFWSRHRMYSGEPWREAGTKEGRVRLAARHARRLLQEERTLKMVMRRNGEVSGLACLTPLDWDTEQFGFPAARIDLISNKTDDRRATADLRGLLERILDQCRRQGLCHLTARVDADELITIHALEHAGFELIDGIQTFTARIPPPLPPAVNGFAEIRLYRQEDLAQILEIARTAYVFDRFHSDAALSQAKADRINEAWVRNCCLGRAADAVIVAAAGDVVLGYVTCKVDSEATRELNTGCGVIGMVATAAAARNMGVALEATRGALGWFHQQDVSVIEVGTQLRNIAAGRLYERCGFRLARVSLTFRKWISDWSANKSEVHSHAI